MIIRDVMDQIGAQLDTIDGLRVWEYDADDIEPPAGIIRLTGDIDYLGAYNRGMVKIELSVLILVCAVDDRVRRDEIVAYADSSGSMSIKQVLETGSYTAFDTLAVAKSKFQVVSIARIKYVGAEFQIKISGRG